MHKNEQPSKQTALVFISILQALLKGFSVFYFLLLPIRYAAGSLQAEGLGSIGALLIVGILAGALGVTYWLHRYPKVRVLQVALGLFFGATVLLFWPESLFVLGSAYLFIGLATGLGMSTINALAAQFTIKGKRYGALAKIAMLTDIVRILYPLVAGGIYLLSGFVGLVIFALSTIALFGLCLWMFTRRYSFGDSATSEGLQEKEPTQSLFQNRSFVFVVALEFLDSFASSQLFVFLPALLVFKQFSIEHAFVMQSAVFFGYLCGRWLIGWIAQRWNGFFAVGVAELGMVVAIAALLTTHSTIFLFILCFLLGAFSRGTSPVIKALAFDQLEPHQVRRGSAMHVIGGDSGSAVGQLLFGLLLAWFGATAPFIGSIVCASVVAIACFFKSKRASLI